MKNLSTDYFLNTSIKLHQNKNGYRFSTDPFLLADFIKCKPGDTLADFGCGNGIISLILASKYEFINITAYEIQKDLSDLTKLNIAENQFEKKITSIHGDIKSLHGEKFDIIMSNPPYTKRGNGRLCSNEERNIARHEIKLTLPELIEAAEKNLKKGGRIDIIYPVLRLTELLVHMKKNGIEPQIIRMIHPFRDADAKRALVSGVKHGKQGLTISPALYIYDKKDIYSQEVQEIMR